MSIRCENCIHNSVCYMQEVCNDIEAQLDEFGCENYKDASRYFLPTFSIGQKLFYIDDKYEKIVPVTLGGFEKIGNCEIWYYISNSWVSVPARIKESDIHKTLFETEEEAQRELGVRITRRKSAEALERTRYGM